MGVQLISIAYLSALGGLLWWAQAPILVGWQPKVVLTGSMLPVIRPGDVALIGPGDAHHEGLPPNRIALVRDPSRESGSYLHRVVRYEADGRMVTKGDANPTEDHPSVPPGRVLGQLRLLVPAVGRPMVWLHDRRYPLLAGSLALTWAAITAALALRGQGPRHGDPAEEDDAQLAGSLPGVLAGAADDRVTARPVAGAVDVVAGLRMAVLHAPESLPVREPVPSDALPDAPALAAVEALVLDLDAFEAAFGSGFGAGDGEDLTGFDGRGFDH
jgi:signal peptidase